MTRYLTAVALIAVAAPARADVIDLAFVRDQAAIGKAVKDLNVERVAVLKFEVQVGDRPPTFDAGLANSKLPQKLENLLVLGNDPADPLMILSGAADKAASLPPTTTWRDAAGRKALAGLTGLPLAWDANQKLTPHAFLCGQLRVAADFSTATVTLYAFTVANPAELKTIYTSPSTPAAAGAVKADRSILSMVGVSYSLDKHTISRTEGDTAALRTTARDFGKQSAFVETLARSPVKLTVLLNGKPVSIQADADTAGGGRLAQEPKKGDAVGFKLTNTGSQKYAVVLAVNGKNTNSMEKLSDLADRDAGSQKGWVLAPGEETTLEGFYNDSKGGFNPFTILDDAQSAALFPLLGSRYRGLITMHVFAEKPPAPAVTPETPKAVAAASRDDAEMTILTLGVGGNALDDVRTSGGPDAARKQLQQLTSVRASADGRLEADPARVASAERGLIALDETRTGGGEIKTVSFAKDPNPVAFVQVRYYGK